MAEKSGDYKRRTYKVALLGILSAQALALSYLENLIPALPGLPPGAKPGFSNIVTMFACSHMGLGAALYITLVKAAFAGLTRGVTAFIMSLSGGLLSTLAMYLLFKMKSKPFSFVGIGVSCAVVHNFAQLIAAFIITGTGAIFYYSPFLLLFAVVTGFVTGTVLKLLMPVLQKQSRYFDKTIKKSIK